MSFHRSRQCAIRNSGQTAARINSSSHSVSRQLLRGRVLVQGRVADIERRRGVKIDLGPRASAAVAPSHPEVHADLAASAKALAIPSMPLASPASHDTATFTVAGVPSCMLFVRNANGSHNPHEAMEIDDFMQAAAVLTRWLVAETAATR